MAYQAVFLDMDHTLCDTGRADQLGLEDFQLALTADYPQESAMRIGAAYLRVIYGEKKGVAGWQKQAAETEVGYRARLLGMTVEQESESTLAADRLVEYATRFMDLRIGHFAFFPGAADMLHRLRQKYTLILVSNGPLFSQEPKIKKVAMDRYVDHIILGGTLPHQKPHPSIFSLACRKAGCAPHEALHVGDLLESDILGAMNAGIASIWIKPQDNSAAPKPVPDYTITNITELEALLSEIDR